MNIDLNEGTIMVTLHKNMSLTLQRYKLLNKSEVDGYYSTFVFYAISEHKCSPHSTYEMQTDEP